MPSKQKSGLYRTKIKIGVDKDGKDVVKWISGKTKRELEEARAQVTAYYIDGAERPDDQFFGDYACEWYTVHKKPYISPSSQEGYKNALNVHLLPMFGERKLRAIKAADLQSYLNTFAGMSTTKITMILSTMRGIFKQACVDRILDIDPSAHLVRPESSKVKEKPALDKLQRKRLERVCSTHHYGAYLAVMYYLGLRPGEARGLRWGDFDWTDDLVHIQRDIDYKQGAQAGALKNKSSDRFIPVPEALRHILVPLRSLPDEYVFVGEISGQPLSKTTSERMWVHLMYAAAMVTELPADSRKYGVNDIRSKYAPLITPHALRHNYITMCWEHGIDVYSTMRLVGHSSYKTTMDIYTHLSNAQLQRTAAQVENMFGKKVAQKLHKAE